jgi:hypothetical protein
MIVFELPGDVTMVILSSWVDLQTLAKFDSALCAAELRTRFLGLIADESFVADKMCRFPHNHQLEWLTQRSMKVRNWVLNTDAAKPCFPDSLKSTAGQHVRSILLRNQSPLGLAKVFSTLAVACSGLQRLKMENCLCGETVNTLSASAQQSLQQLILLECHDGCWTSYTQLPNLLKLHIKELCGADVIQSVTSLLTASPNLIDLRLSSFSKAPINAMSLLVLSNHAAKLEVLELDMVHQLFTAADVVSLAERCGNLRTLSLVCGRGVTEVAVEAFALHCSRLEALHLLGPLDSTALSAVAMHSGSTLRYLSLTIGQYEPAGLNLVADHCRLLEELQLQYCRFPTDDPFVRLVSSLLCLREFLLVECCNITDKVLIAIATHLPNLTNLGLYRCGNDYTETGALALVTALTKLRRFCLDTCDTTVFTPALRKRWQEASPGLHFSEVAQVPTRYFQRMSWY